ncbi:LGFP repeat-containing protein, partial [Streptomyces sp. NPDC058171]
IFTSPNGGVWAVLGQIFKTWQSLGADNGELGLPTSDEYSIPGGLRTDFENGSLIFNELTGIVTKVLKTYNDTYAEAYKNGARVNAAAPVAPPADPAQIPPAPAEPAPAPAPAPEPAPAPAPVEPAPVPAG